MRQWKDDIDNVTALYPSFAAWESKPYGHYIGTVTDTATVPATPFKMVLDFRPVRGKLGITLNAAAASLIEWGQTPTTGQVAVDYIGGNVEFAAADAAKTAVATYAEHYGSVLSAADWMQVQKDLVATQAAASGPVQLVTVGKQNADYTTIQAAIDAVDALGDCGAAKPYAIAIAPGVYSESVVVDVAYLTLIGLGGPEACVVRNDHDDDGATWEPAVSVQASNVTLSGLGIRNLFTLAGTEATIALGVGTKAGTGTYSDVIVRGCVVTGNGRDALYVRGGGSVTIEDTVITGLSHSPAFETCAATGYDGKALVVNARRLTTTTTYAAWWTYAATGETLTLNADDCTVNCSSGEAWLYLNSEGTETINARGVRCTAGMVLYQTPALHTGATTINHSGVVVDADRTGALVGTVTLAAREQRDSKFESVTTVGNATVGANALVTGYVKVASVGLFKDGGTINQMDMRNGGDTGDGNLQVGRLLSTVATGTAPLTVASTTKVTNLNADLLDDLSSAAFVQHSIADAKGDLLAASADDTITRVAAGADGYAVVYDSAAAAGIAAAAVTRPLVNAVASTELHTHTAETAYDKTVSIPAAWLTAGRLLRIRAWGKFSCASAGNITLKVYLGALAGYVAAVVASAGWANEPMMQECLFTVDTTGASGTGNRAWGTNQIRSALANLYATAGTIGDTTAAMTVAAKVTWSVSDAGNKSTLLGLSVEALN